MPYIKAKEFLGRMSITLLEQRAKCIAQIQDKYKKDPLQFVRDMFPWETDPILKQFGGVQPWQEKVLDHIGEKIRAGETKVYVAVASGNGVGKTTITAWLEIWFLCCYVNSKSITTSARFSQLIGTTWMNVIMWVDKFKYKPIFQLDAQARKLIVANKSTWYGEPKSWNSAKPESFQGEHRSCQKITLDEASGIDDALFETLLGARMTQGEIKIFLFFGNLTRNTGAFYDMFYKSKDEDFLRLHVDVREVSFSDKKEIQKIIDEYGELSDEFRVRVQGLPPLKSDGSFFSPADIDSALRSFGNIPERSPESPVVIGVDVATGEGEDFTVIAVRRDNIVLHLDVFKGDTDESARRVVRTVNTWGGTVYIDQVGVGTGLYHSLRSMRLDVVGVFGHARSCDPARYFNLRAELFSKMKAWLFEGAGMGDEFGTVAIYNKYDGVKEDFLNVRSKPNEKNGSIQIMSKKEIGGKSTDIADAISYTFASPDFFYLQNARQLMPKQSSYYKKSSFEGGGA